MKKLIVLVVIISILSAAIPVMAAEEDAASPYLTDAEKLNALGLFLGTDIGFELHRVPRRAEAAVMLVRLLGLESEALGGGYIHPFTDVPEWADPYVGLLYQNELTKGIGGNLYDPYSDVDAKTYLTFVMRALGYSDDEGDFNWESAVDDALGSGLINSLEHDVLSVEVFTRGHMAAMSYNALNSLMKDTRVTLAASLIESGAVDLVKAIEENFLLGPSLEKDYLSYLDDGKYMPYLVGLDKETAIIMLRKAGINGVAFSSKYSDLNSKDTVISQTYPAYAPSGDVTDLQISLSLGPSPVYHGELVEICKEKGWDSEVTPYIIASAKYLIKNTVLSKYDVFNKLRENLDEIVILNDEYSAGMGYAAFYDAATRDMYINRYVLDYELILHELTHAMSNNFGTGKVGFTNSAENDREVTEAFVESISSRASGSDTGSLNKFKTDSDEIIFAGTKYFSDRDENFLLGVYGPLFILAGENSVEKMFFRDISVYGREVLEFNEKYGEQKWETLWGLAESFSRKTGFLSDEEKHAKASVYTEYLDDIIDCLYIDLDLAGSDDSKLRLLLLKLEDIKEAYPLNYLDYRERFNSLEKEIAGLVSEPGKIKVASGPLFWIVPDYTGKSPEYAYNSLSIAGYASGIGYSVIEAENNETGIARVLYKEPGAPTIEAVEIYTDDELPTGAEYIIEIYGQKIPEGNYLIMRNLKENFAEYLADYNNLGNYAVGRLLETEGFDLSYEFSYYDYVSPAMQGRIVGQFPYPGTAVIPGTTLIRIFMLREN